MSDNDNAVVESKFGGAVQSIQFGSEGSSSNLREPGTGGGVEVRENKGVQSLEADGRGVIKKMDESINTYVNPKETLAETGSVMSTVRTLSGGSNIEGKAAKDLVVTIEGGMDISLEVAQRMGLVAKDAAGNYSDTGKKPLASEEAGEKDNPDLAGKLEAYTESRLADIGEAIGDSAVLSIVSQVAAKISLDENGNATIEDFKDLNGLTDEQADNVAEVLPDAISELQQQASKHLTETLGLEGSDYEDFVSWAYGSEDARGIFMECVQKHYSSGDLSGYSSLLSLYRSNGAYWKPNK